MRYRPLYIIDSQIAETIEEAIDPETGEIIDESKLDKLKALDMERDAKIEGIGLYYKDVVSELAQVEAEKKQFDVRIKALKNKAESLKRCLTKALDGEKFSTPRLTVSYKHSDSVEIDDLSAIPGKYLKFMDPDADKMAIKRALKAGEEVPGVILQTNTSTIIK